MVSNRPNRRDRNRKKKQHKPAPPLTKDTVVSLTPQGRSMLEQILALSSQEAGRPITGEELLEVMRAVKAELGTQTPDLLVPENYECFKRHLRELGRR